MAVSLVLVSHSEKLAQGLVELAAQMASEVQIKAAGGRDDGGIGTSFDKVNTAISDLLDDGQDVLVLTDLGSATMTVESVLDFLDDDDAAVFVDAPFVEAAVAAAVAAQSGKSLRECAQVARDAAKIFREDPFAQLDASTEGGKTAPQAPQEQASSAEEPALEAQTRSKSAHSLSQQTASAVYERTVRVVDTVGLHARPAAKVAQMAADTDGHVLINGEPADSLLSIMTLGIECGEDVNISSDDPQFNAVVDLIAEKIAAGLDRG